MYTYASQPWREDVCSGSSDCECPSEHHNSAIIVLGSGLYDWLGTINVRANTKDGATKGPSKTGQRRRGNYAQPDRTSTITVVRGRAREGGVTCVAVGRYGRRVVRRRRGAGMKGRQ